MEGVEAGMDRWKVMELSLSMLTRICSITSSLIRGMISEIFIMIQAELTIPAMPIIQSKT
jgi:hypothetical protein